MKTKTNTILVVVLVLSWVVKFTPMESHACSAVVPISITVNGRIVVTDAVDDSSTKGRSGIIQQSILVRKRKGSDIYKGQSSLRIRSNLKKWQLLTNRTDSDSNNLDSDNFYITYDIEHAANANPLAASLTRKFKGEVPLANIPSGSSVVLVNGKTKTSIARDSKNANNWVGVNLKYTYYPKNEENLDNALSTVISYSVVSP